MCGKRFEIGQSSDHQQRQHLLQLQQTESAGNSSSMSAYGRSGVREAPFLPWSMPAAPSFAASPIQWTIPAGNERLFACMASNNRPPPSSYPGFHCSPLQFSYDHLRESASAGIYGSKTASGFYEHESSMLQHGQRVVNGPSGLLMDSLVPGDMLNVTKMTAQEIIDAKALAASKSHSEAERRRRERINAHLATLRSLLPSTTKTDKASLLAEVIEHVKELKRQASEISEGSLVPTETDELTVDSDTSCGDGKLLIKASVCCDDRPELLSDLIKTLRTLRLRTLKAEITTLGGRVKNVLLITNVDDSTDANTDTQPPSVSCIHDALKAVMERSNSEESPPGSLISNKRQRGLNQLDSIHHILEHRSI